MPPTSTRERAPKITPFGLSNIIFPLAVILPSIWEDFPPWILLTVIEEVEGCLKSTCSERPRSKLSHCIIDRLEVCLIVVVEPAFSIVVVPATTEPPLGEAKAIFVHTIATATRAVVERKDCKVERIAFISIVVLTKIITGNINEYLKERR